MIEGTGEGEVPEVPEVGEIETVGTVRTVGAVEEVEVGFAEAVAVEATVMQRKGAQGCGQVEEGVIGEEGALGATGGLEGVV